MNTASLELCIELYKLSGWWFPYTESADYWTCLDRSGKQEDGWHMIHYFGPKDETGDYQVPAYNLGFLIRKLPHQITLPGLYYVGDYIVEQFYLDMELPEVNWPSHGTKWAYYYFNGGESVFWSEADTPEDAACKLAILLFKQGKLTKKAQ